MWNYDDKLTDDNKFLKLDECEEECAKREDCSQWSWVFNKGCRIAKDGNGTARLSWTIGFFFSKSRPLMAFRGPLTGVRGTPVSASYRTYYLIFADVHIPNHMTSAGCSVKGATEHNCLKKDGGMGICVFGFRKIKCSKFTKKDPDTTTAVQISTSASWGFGLGEKDVRLRTTHHTPHTILPIGNGFF